MKVPERKEYGLTVEERQHIEHLSYAMQYLDQTLGIFLQTVVVGRLGCKEGTKYKLEGDKIIIQNEP